MTLNKKLLPAKSFKIQLDSEIFRWFQTETSKKCSKLLKNNRLAGFESNAVIPEKPSIKKYGYDKYQPKREYKNSINYVIQAYYLHEQGKNVRASSPEGQEEFRKIIKKNFSIFRSYNLRTLADANKLVESENEKTIKFDLAHLTLYCNFIGGNLDSISERLEKECPEALLRQNELWKIQSIDNYIDTKKQEKKSNHTYYFFCHYTYTEPNDKFSRIEDTCLQKGHAVFEDEL